MNPAAHTARIFATEINDCPSIPIFKDRKSSQQNDAAIINMADLSNCAGMRLFFNDKKDKAAKLNSTTTVDFAEKENKTGMMNIIKTRILL